MTDAALILVGHGSSRIPDAGRPILDLAEAVRARGVFAEVACAFMKQPPFVEGAPERVEAALVHVVPVFAGKGYYTDQLVPRAMGLEGAETRRGGKLIRYTAPAGTHPGLPGILARRAVTLARGAGVDHAKAGLLLIAHGSSRPGGAGETPRAIAAAIARAGLFAEVALCFLEQEPFARDWPALTRARDLVVLPLLVAQGLHAGADIPPLFGLRPGETGPAHSHGRRVRLMGGLGAEPELVDIVLDLAGA